MINSANTGEGRGTVAEAVAGLQAMDRQLAAPLIGLALPARTAASPAPQVAALPSDGDRSYQVVRGVAVVALRGVLTPNYEFAQWFGWTTYHGFAGVMAELAAAEDVAAVVIEADSPGGMVLGLESASDAVAALAAVKPVHVLVNPLAASAAYWIASQASEIVLTPGAIVGSIGVGLQTYSFVGPSQIYGEQWFSVTSSHARAKWPDPATPEGMAELKRDLDQVEARFHAAVAAGRKIAPADLTARLSSTGDPRDGGAIFAGADAIARGLADRQETRAAFYDRVLGAYGSKTTARGGRARSAAAVAAARARIAAAQAAVT